MQMFKPFKVSVFVTIITLLSVNVINAQNTDALGAYTPYSLFGIGEISPQGTSYNRGMGGIGIGMRDHRYINYANVASITERDTLSFMMDFGVVQKNTYISDINTKGAYNVFNMHNIVISFPIKNKAAAIMGITPYSETGYKFMAIEDNLDIINDVGDVKYYKYGYGAVNKAFIGFALPVFKRLSLGVEGIYYFGTINRKSEVTFTSSPDNIRSLELGWENPIKAFGAKFGLQYSQPIKGGSSLTLGATYSLKTDMKGDITHYAFAKSSQITDTLYFNQYENSISIPEEIGVGLSYRHKDKWVFGVDYLRQDWKNIIFADYPGVDFSTSVKENYKAGFEITPNRYDIRYYMKRATYRGGVYYEKSYMSFGNKQVNSMGVTFGMTLPIFRWYNGITFAVDLGQRGEKSADLVRERYAILMININLHDIWFQKFKYQ